MDTALVMHFLMLLQHLKCSKSSQMHWHFLELIHPTISLPVFWSFRKTLVTSRSCSHLVPQGWVIKPSKAKLAQSPLNPAFAESVIFLVCEACDNTFNSKCIIYSTSSWKLGLAKPDDFDNHNYTAWNFVLCPICGVALTIVGCTFELKCPGLKSICSFENMAKFEH